MSSVVHQWHAERAKENESEAFWSYDTSLSHATAQRRAHNIRSHNNVLDIFLFYVHVDSISVGYKNIPSLVGPSSWLRAIV